MNIRSLLLEYYLAWQKELGEERTWKQFAEKIGIDHIYLNKIYNGKRQAGEKTIQLLADYFHDMRYYDVVGLDRPDPTLSEIRRSWPGIPDEVKKKIHEEIAPYIAK